MSEATNPAGDVDRPIAIPHGFSHVRLTVTDIRRSKEFYTRLFGQRPGSDFSDQIDDLTIHDDPDRTYGGCSFTFNGQTLGLRPVAPRTDTFNPDRVGLDHVSFMVASVEDLHDAAARLEEAGIEHGKVTDLPAFGIAILPLQDPDDINLELATPLR
ncbi:VOC family protein [Frondihabitans australicus]|uniref:Catechol 2,3-dioxygenase-like lactoylglutathione lyase family enzyme n=1 Tax=Frondihabitans australicus TaxID=386892 RepID=A0A495IFZ4_9MICO|nr:VOC family protein [Frondihabitans australicus]RKR74864.1 catechol 2,3-dioxygenase-like lactoylglutathione lyase family enzyme [Frondihabitans australicus]